MDVSGSFLENSTAYDYLIYNKLDSLDDYESKKRFYHDRDLTLDVRPNRFAYRVWFESMNLRYFIEMAFFLANVLVFQLYITSFNKDMHLLQVDIDHLVELNVF